MRKAIAVTVICFAVVLAFTASVLLVQAQSSKPEDAAAAGAQITPLNMKTGLWQTTMTGKYTGLPPQIASAMNATHTYKSCVKPEELKKNEWAKGLAGLKCSSVTVLKSTGTDTEVEAKGCEAGNGITAEGRGKFHLVDSGHLTGSMDVSFVGGNPFGGSGSVHMTSNYNSNWVGSSCPANMD